MQKLTDEEAEKIGQSCRGAQEGNLLVGSFAAELVGESYPFTMSMSQIVFKGYTDVQLGHKFAEWCK